MEQDQTLTVLVPLTIRKRGGRKEVVTPDGATPWASPEVPVNRPIIKALARAFRWRRLLEDGHYSSIRALAAKEGIDRAYVGRVLNLSLLAPDIVESILDGRELDGHSLLRHFGPVAEIWAMQHITLPAG